MNSKERVKKTIAGEPADKFSFGFYVVDCGIIEKVIGRKTYVGDKMSDRSPFGRGDAMRLWKPIKKILLNSLKKLTVWILLPSRKHRWFFQRTYVPNPPKKIGDEI